MDEGFRRPLLILGPYRGASRADYGANVARALALGKLGRALGWSPIVPHAAGWLGLFGHPLEADPLGRATALACGLSLVGCVALHPEAACWVLLDGEGKQTEGVAGEVSHWTRLGGAAPRCDTWEGWRRSFAGLDMADVHDAAVWPLSPPKPPRRASRPPD